MITTLLLAAGSGRRFGSQKLLAKLPDGRSVIAAAVENLAGCSDRIVAVVGADDALANTLRALGCKVVQNPRADEGMGTSIAAGIAASVESDGWLIALGDMPYVNSQTVAAVKATMRPGGIVVPQCAGRNGHPVGFGSAYREELLALLGDTGARLLLDRHAQTVVHVPVLDEGILRDIDLPSDIR